MHCSRAVDVIHNVRRLHHCCHRSRESGESVLATCMQPQAAVGPDRASMEILSEIQ